MKLYSYTFYFDFYEEEEVGEENKVLGKEGGWSHARWTAPGRGWPMLPVRGRGGVVLGKERNGTSAYDMC